MRPRYSAEFKLNIVRQIEDGRKRCADICKEYGLASGMVSRWCQEYRERGGESAWGTIEFLPSAKPGLIERIARLEHDNAMIKHFFSTMN